jgi:hypothetical protein
MANARRALAAAREAGMTVPAAAVRGGRCISAAVCASRPRDDCGLAGRIGGSRLPSKI